MTTRPKVRAAAFGDIPAVFALMRDAHARSRLNRWPIDEKAAKALLMQGVQRHGGATAGSTFFAVAEVADGVEAFLLGVLQPVYLTLEALEATDLFWIARTGAHPWSAPRLVRAFHRWAAKAPGLAFVRQATTDVVNEAARPAHLLRRHGMSVVGAVYEKESTLCQG